MKHHAKCEWGLGAGVHCTCPRTWPRKDTAKVQYASWRPTKAQADARELANEMAADTVAEALERDRIKFGRPTADYKEISRRVGREMGRTLHRIIAEQGCTITTLADVAQALDHTLIVQLRPNYPISR